MHFFFFFRFCLLYSWMQIKYRLINIVESKYNHDFYYFVFPSKNFPQRFPQRYYTIISRSTQAEVQQVVSRFASEGSQTTGQGTTRRDCIRLRGLPYEAHVENIVEFLGESARHIVFQVG